MVPVLSLAPTEDVLPWRIVAADVLVVGVVACLGYLGTRWLVSRLKVGTGRGQWILRQWILRYAWVGLAASVLFLRESYGPPIRLLLTAKSERCRQRLADRLDSSPAARAWKALHTIEWLVKGVPESEIPRFLYGDLMRIGEDGIRRLDDARLLFRMDAIAQGFADAEKNGCGADGWHFLDALWRLNPQAREVWFDMLFDAIVAEILERPAVREVSEEDRAEILAALRPARLQRILDGHDESPRQLLCREVESLYTLASTLKGARRVAAARLLAVEPIGGIGDL
jgi:hypothetical protein